MTRMLTRIFGLALLLAAGLVGPSALPAQDSPKQDIKDAGHETKAVSYTHLTLPTILRV